jgi:hypothetical protein
MVSDPANDGCIWHAECATGTRFGMWPRADAVHMVDRGCRSRGPADTRP